MMKWLKRITLTLLIIILLVLGALAWILGTQSGLHFAINSAARWVPGLTINSVNGGWQDLRLTGVEYQMRCRRQCGGVITRLKFKLFEG